MRRKKLIAWRPRDPKSPEISNIALVSAVCVATRRKSGAEIQNLSESIRLVVFDHVRSYIWIIRRDSRAILYIFRAIYLSLIIGAAIRRSTKFFQNLWVGRSYLRRFMRFPKPPRI